MHWLKHTVKELIQCIALSTIRDVQEGPCLVRPLQGLPLVQAEEDLGRHTAGIGRRQVAGCDEGHARCRHLHTQIKSAKIADRLEEAASVSVLPWCLPLLSQPGPNPAIVTPLNHLLPLAPASSPESPPASSPCQLTHLNHLPQGVPASSPESPPGCPPAARPVS